MPTSFIRFATLRERAGLIGALLVFLLVLVLCTVNLYQDFERFTSEKAFLRQTQTKIKELTQLESNLSRMETSFRTFLLTKNPAWSGRMANDHNAFQNLYNQLASDTLIKNDLHDIPRLMATKMAMQDSILSIGNALPSQAGIIATRQLSSATLDRLLEYSASIRRKIQQAIIHQNILLQHHRQIQDQVQPRIIWLFAAITLVVILLMVFLFAMAFRNMVKRTRASEQIKVLLDTTHDGFYLLSTTWQILLMNEKAKMYLDVGTGGNSRIGQNILDLFPEPDKHGAANLYEQVLEGKVLTWKQKLELNGKPCLIELQHKVVREKEGGAPLGISILARDITEQEQAETARAASEQTRKLIMNASQDAIICIDRSGRISYWNNKAEQVFGWTEAEALGKRLNDTIIPSYHRQGHNEGFDRYSQTGEHHVMNKLLELTAIDKSGRDFPIEMFIMELKGESEEFICAFIRDITERKQAENERNKLLERLRFTNDMVQLGTWQYHAATETLVCDEVVYALLEQPRSYNLDRNNWLDLIHPDDREAVSVKLAAFVAGENELELYFRIITPAGRTKFLYQKAVKNRDADGQTVDAVGGVIDITQLKKAEATFRQVVNVSPNALLLVNSKGAIVLANQQAELLFGYAEEELKEISVERLIPGRFGPQVALKQALNLKETEKKRLGASRELFAAHKNGSEIPVEVGLSTMELEDEKLVLASIVDISQRKEAEAERQELLTRFELAANATNLGIWDFDLETGTLLWNDNMYELAELPATAPVNFEVWRSLVHPEDVETTLHHFQQAVELARPQFEMEYRIAPPSGEVKTLHQKAITFRNADGVVVRCLGTSQDVTAERQADAIREELITRFELAAETLHLGILDADLRSGNVQGDTQLKLMLGIEAIPNPDWRVWVKQVHPEDRSRLQDLLMQALPQGALLQAEWRQVRAGGNTRHFETKARIIWKNGQPSRLIAATIDVTDRVKQRNELIAARIQAEKSEQLQEQFLANMSHEIRTPLNGIVGMADLMGGTMLTQRQREYLQVVQNSSQGLLTIINDVLDISKIKSGKFSIENAPFNLHHVLISAFEMLQLRATQKNLLYQMQVDPAVPVTVRGDAGRLSQVLINLLGNAVKFTREGSVVLTVHPAGEEDGKMRLLFTVTDTGIGMTEEARQEVFQSFAQASREVGIEFGGTGLGLAISKQLVEMQGGTIEVESTLGLGSSFRVMLAYEVVQDGFTDKTVTQENIAMDQHQGKRVLVAEDNEVNRMVINEYLQKAGLLVTLVNDGKQAVDQLVAKPDFDLVILDLRMPVMNGFEAATAIRKELQLSIPIMALSASTLRSEKEHCLALGMNAYMAKPFKAAELYDNIFSLLSGNLQQESNSVEVHSGTAIPLYDLSELQLLGEPDFALQIIDSFIDNGRRTLDELSEALEQNKVATVFELSHRMKGSAGSLGAFPLMERLKEMETEARSSKPDMGRLQAMLPGIVNSFAQVCTALEAGKDAVAAW